MKKDALIVSDDLQLPLSYATSRNMALAQSGTGKSNVCVVLAEEMHRVKIPWVTIDTKGDWYGIRSNRSGKQRGLDVPVFGGEYGDLPLSPLAGTRMAELVAAGKFMGVLDVSDFPKTSDVSRFLIDFATTLLKKQRTPVHLFLEECSDYLPQGGYRGQVDPLAAACVGAMKRLATKGRFRGIGYTVISQRPAEVNKTVLYQCETLIALRMVGDLDVKWIEGWVKRSSARAPELLSTLHELENGEGWVWSPGKLKIIERVKFRRRETFDSGAEPEIGKARLVPKMAPVELDALRKELADLEEQEKGNDPRVLRQKIAELERAKPADTGDTAALRMRVKELEDREKRFNAEKRELRQIADLVLAGANGAAFQAKRLTDQMGKAALAEPLKSAVEKGGKTAAKAIVAAIKEIPPPTLHVRKSQQHGTRDPLIGKGGLCRMMIALAQKPMLTKSQLALRAGMSMSGTFATYLATARKQMWVDGDPLRLTDRGAEALGDYEPLPTGDRLFDYWVDQVGGGGIASMLRVLRISYPSAISKPELAERSEMSMSGTFATYLAKLRGLQLIEGKNEIKLSSELVDQ